MTTDDGTVQIHGKAYNTVAKRVKQFRTDFPDYTIKTKILSNADMILIQAKICAPDGRVLATGNAEEERGRTQILSTSALETAETSAVGRALAFLGYPGTEIASDEEIAQAKAQHDEMMDERIQELVHHNSVVREHIESIVAIKTYLLDEDYSSAFEAISEIPDEDKASLWRAPTKGGIWTTQERGQMKSNEWNQAKRDFHGLGEINDDT